MRHLAEASRIMDTFGPDASPVHLKTSSKQVLGIALLVLASLGVAGAPAIAQVNLYDSDDVAINVGLDAATVVFTQSNPWFGEPEANIGVGIDTWAEFAVEPQLYLTLKNVFGGALSAGVSAVATQTFGESADGFATGNDDPGAVTLEKLYASWRIDLGGDDFFETIGGDFDYQIGTGFLLKDGGSDGGDRGGFYLGARSASRSSGLVRLKRGDLLLEGFWLGNNPGRGGIDAHVGGFNAEYDISERASIGATYIEVVHFDAPVTPNTAEELRTYDLRASFDVSDRLTFSGEYARQDGGGYYQGRGWYLQVHYTFDNLPFEPALTYRYAVVTGDDPATAQNEGFVPLAYGFTDYGQWYQGEITGNWVFGNSNQITHMIKGSATLADSVSLTASWLNFTLDEPGLIGVADEAFGDEFDVFLDWQATDRLFLSVAAAVMVPGEGAVQFTGGDETWSHLMFYASIGY